MASMILSRVPYIINVIILLPVCTNMYVGDYARDVFENTIEKSEGLRYLVASLWTTFLLASIGGITMPAQFKLLLLIQIMYKSLYLASYLIPRAWKNGKKSVPVGIFGIFAFIVVTYPYFLMYT